MPSDARFIAHVHDQCGLGHALTSRRMFGEYALYLEGKVVALVCDNHLFLKSTTAVLTLWPDPAQGQPFPGARPWLVADEWLDEPERLRALLRITADALPWPTPKKKRPPGASARKPSSGQRLR